MWYALINLDLLCVFISYHTRYHLQKFYSIFAKIIIVQSFVYYRPIYRFVKLSFKIFAPRGA